MEARGASPGPGSAVSALAPTKWRATGLRPAVSGTFWTPRRRGQHRGRDPVERSPPVAPCASASARRSGRRRKSAFSSSHDLAPTWIELKLLAQ